MRVDPLHVSDRSSSTIRGDTSDHAPSTATIVAGKQENAGQLDLGLARATWAQLYLAEAERDLERGQLESAAESTHHAAALGGNTAALTERIQHRRAEIAKGTPAYWAEVLRKAIWLVASNINEQSRLWREGLPTLAKERVEPQIRRSETQLCDAIVEMKLRLQPKDIQMAVELAAERHAMIHGNPSWAGSARAFIGVYLEQPSGKCATLQANSR